MRFGILLVSCTLVLFSFLLVSKGGTESPVQTLEITLDTSYIDYNLPGEKVQKIDSFFKSRHLKHRFNGCILFADSHKYYENYYGYKSFKKKDSLNIESVFQLASVSKPFTAMAALVLVEEGKISLSDTVEKFLPNFPYKGITIKMLLNHSSGLPDYRYIMDSVWKEHEVPMSNKEAYKILLDQKPYPYNRPGRSHQYNNTNFFILANIIESASGQSFDSFMHEKIFAPAGMNNSFIWGKPNYRELPNVAIGHWQNNSEMVDYYQNGVVGDKSMYSNTTDIWKFSKCLNAHKLVSDSLLKIAFAPQFRKRGNRKNYGLGWRIYERENKENIIYHTGWWRGYRTYFIMLPEQDKTIVILNNHLRGSFLNIEKVVDLIE